MSLVSLFQFECFFFVCVCVNHWGLSDLKWHRSLLATQLHNRSWTHTHKLPSRSGEASSFWREVIGSKCVQNVYSWESLANASDPHTVTLQLEGNQVCFLTRSHTCTHTRTPHYILIDNVTPSYTGGEFFFTFSDITAAEISQTQAFRFTAATSLQLPYTHYCQQAKNRINK